MTPAEFEEKDFEGPLYNQLLFGHHHIATPGQVFEGKYGIDAALHALHPLFWDLFGYPDAPPGCILDHFNWGWVWRRRGSKRPLPNFSTNLLIQSKRPYVILKAGANVSPHGPMGPLWRFSIREHQQPLLERVSSTLGHRALVVYASPAFDTYNSLNDHTSSQTIVENCSYVKVARLQGHSSWVYAGPGTHGVAHSEPENVEDAPFEKMLDELSEHHNPESDASKDLYLLSSSLTEMCREMSQTSPLARHLLRKSERLTKIITPDTENRPYIHDYFNTSLLLRGLGVSWMVLGR